MLKIISDKIDELSKPPVTHTSILGISLLNEIYLEYKKAVGLERDSLESKPESEWEWRFEGRRTVMCEHIDDAKAALSRLDVEVESFDPYVGVVFICNKCKERD